jgi:hypothetical protein
MASSRKVQDSSVSAKDVPLVDTTDMRSWDWFLRLYLDQKDPKLIEHLDKKFTPPEIIIDEASDEEESSEEKKSSRLKREAENRKVDKTLLYIIRSSG